MGESGKAGGDVFLGVILLPSPSPHGEFGSSLHLVVRALTQVSRLQGSFYISLQSLSRVWLFATPWIAARQASLSITNSRSLLKLISIESVMPSNHLILCQPLPLLPSFLPSIKVFSNESALCIRWPKYQSFSFSIIPSNEYSGMISSRFDWFNLLALLSRVFPSTTIWKHQFFDAQPSSWSNSHICTWLLEKP